MDNAEKKQIVTHALGAEMPKPTGQSKWARSLLVSSLTHWPSEAGGLCSDWVPQASDMEGREKQLGSR